jgi:hypothetical protein
MSNKDRAYKIQRLLGLQDDGKAEYLTVADAICDLRHYCDLHKINWQNEKSMANDFYDAETYQEEPLTKKESIIIASQDYLRVRLPFDYDTWTKEVLLKYIQSNLLDKYTTERETYKLKTDNAEEFWEIILDKANWYKKGTQE